MKESSTTSLDLNGLHLPELPSWFPLAWGWWASLAYILIVMLIIGLAVRWHRRRLAPKKTALRLLSLTVTPQTPSSAIELVRQAALCYYPREEIAHLIERLVRLFRCPSGPSTLRTQRNLVAASLIPETKSEQC